MNQLLGSDHKLDDNFQILHLENKGPGLNVLQISKNLGIQHLMISLMSLRINLLI